MGKTMRDAYGEALARYGADNPDVVVLDADVSSSSKSSIFAAACPERFYNVGIAEANMVAMAAGFAAAGKIPFVNSFSVFLSTLGLLAARTFGSYAGLNIKLIGAYSGLSDSFDGPTHHSLEDLAVLRSLPGFSVYAASDNHSTDWLVRHAIATRGPMYIRLSRGETDEVHTAATRFEDKRSLTVREGRDVAILACGAMIGQAIWAAQRLERQGISARVVDMLCIKPLDRTLVLRAAADTGAIVTAEEHNVIGGLGGAVAETLSMAGVGVPHLFVGVQDRHAESGPYDALLTRYGLDADAIAAAVQLAIEKKQTRSAAFPVDP